LKKKLGIYL